MRALILGVSGQDGSYLAEQLVAEGHEVWGGVRRASSTTVLDPDRLVFADLLDQDSLERALLHVVPDVVFNLAAVTSPGGGWGASQPPLLAEVTGVGVLRLLVAMESCSPHTKLVHASSSAIYDLPRYGPYGAAKQFAHESVVGYRSELHCSNAVLFSHTSPRQDPRFLARRICTAVARSAAGEPFDLVLTDVDSRRDWGYAPDYMRAFRMIADLEPGDYQIATGETHSVRELVEAAAAAVGTEWVTRSPRERTIPDEVNPGTHPIVPGWKPETSFVEMVEALCS